MNPFNLPFAGKLCLVLCLVMILRPDADGQCTNNLSTRSFDTVLNGIGYGTYALRFPQWNPDSGTLISVKITARVSVQYSFTLTDVDAISSVYTLRVGREDKITGSALAVPYDNIVEKQVGVYSLDPGDVVSQGPFAFLDNYINTDSITLNTVPFQGTGFVNLTYSPITYTDLRTSNNSGYGYHATAQDAMDVSVTYLYCNAQVALASELISFDAVAVSPSTARLDWAATNEMQGRQYEIQRSQDGRSFVTVASVPATGESHYNYMDEPTTVSGHTFYYRLLINDWGNPSYSPTRVITLPTAGVAGWRIYPVPATDFINIVPDSRIAGSAAGWIVSLYSASGSLIQQQRYNAATVLRLDFQHRLAAGVYFIRVADGTGQHRFATSFLVAPGR